MSKGEEKGGGANLTRREFLQGTGAAALTGLSVRRASGWEPAANDPGACSFRGEKLDVDFAGYLSRHDIVYLTPAEEGYDGFPIGNGDVGAMVWTPPERLKVVINKTNTWDDADDEEGDHRIEEKATALRSCGELSIENGTPCFDWMYLSDFEGRLSLYEAEARFRAKTAISEVSASLFVDAHSNVLVINYEDETAFETERKIRLQRWGSRVMPFWEGAISNDVTVGLGGTQAFTEGRETWIEQQLSRQRFVVVLRCLGLEVTKQVIHPHLAEVTLPRGKEVHLTLLVAVVTSEDHAEPLRHARELLDAAESKGVEKVRAEHRSYWSDFWSRSLISIPDDYFENLWYFNFYQLGSASRGAYPEHMNIGIWNWNHDQRQWTYSYHYEMRHIYWPQFTANHLELSEPYFRFYTRVLPKAEEAARKYFGAKGAAFADVSNRRGDQYFDWAPVDNWNLPAGTQIGRTFYWHYLYTQDKDFLRETAYPIMKACSLFYLSLLKREADGTYYLPKSSPYENANLLRNCLVDLIEIKASFKALVEASKVLGVDEELREKWQDVLDHFPCYIVRDIGADTIIHVLAPHSSPPLLLEMRATEPLEGTLPNPWPLKAPGKIFCLGKDCNGVEVFEDCLGRSASIAYPAGEIGLEEKGTELYDVAVNTLRFADRACNPGTISPVTIGMARLGLGEEAYEHLKLWVRRNQHYPQGLFYHQQQILGSRWYYGGLEEQADKGINPPRNLTEQIHYLRGQYYYDRFPRYDRGRVWPTGTPVSRRMVPFYQCAPGPMGIFAATINEMLLHSYGGKIRVFPAVPSGWGGKFMLRAEGAFLVTSEKDGGGPVKYVAVRSLAGAPCAVVNPWKEKVEVLDASGGNRKVLETGEPVISFPTEKGHTYVVERVAKPLRSYRVERLSGVRNETEKRFEEVSLGKARDF